MPNLFSHRRLKALLLICTAAFCTLLYLSNEASSKIFYDRTSIALDRKAALEKEEVVDRVQPSTNHGNRHENGGLQNSLDEESTGSKRPASPKVASEILLEKPTPKKRPSNDALAETKDGDVAGLNSVKDSKMLTAPREGRVSSADLNKASISDDKGKDSSAKIRETQEDDEVEQEINAILKRGPMIIFSKSYCPYSTKAKRILLQDYSIVPVPYVVELDQHHLGSKLQVTLHQMTGRRTVPNVLINGKSIGGGDDIEALSRDSILIDKIRELGGKRIVDARKLGVTS